MIKIVCNMNVKADKVDEMKATAQELVAKSQAEAGNISYTLNQSTTNPQAFAMIEVWKDQEAIDLHNASEHFTTILPKIGALCDGDPVINLYTEVQY